MKKNPLLLHTNKKKIFIKFNIVFFERIFLYSIVNYLAVNSKFTFKNTNFNFVRLLASKNFFIFKVNSFVFSKLSTSIRIFSFIFVFQSFFFLKKFIEQSDIYLNIFFNHKKHFYSLKNLGFLTIRKEFELLCLFQFFSFVFFFFSRFIFIFLTMIQYKE